MTGRIIRDESCLAEGAAWLAGQEPRFARALAATGPLPLRLRPDGFVALLDAIVSQQISVAAADAIWARLEAAGATSEAGLLRQSDEALRGLGLSWQKIAYARGLAEARLDYERFRAAPTAEVIATLTALKGIGIWTAEIYAMFSLARADVFAPGDLALQEGVRDLFGLTERPKERALRQMAESWSPWRSVAARLIWAWYRLMKDREGVR
jgi:DNA-3-methyladenine glycosylase II